MSISYHKCDIGKNILLVVFTFISLTHFMSTVYVKYMSQLKITLFVTLKCFGAFLYNDFVLLFLFCFLHLHVLKNYRIFMHLLEGCIMFLVVLTQCRYARCFSLFCSRETAAVVEPARQRPRRGS